MNKNQIVMCSIGGVALVAAAVLGFFIYSAYAERTEKLDELDSSASAVKRINSAKVSPEQASVDAIAENTKLLTIWEGESRHIAAQGDRVVDADMTPEAFKRLLVDEARVEAARPGGVDGKIVKDGFAFGFKDYILGGAMPDRERLAFLQRQWEDVKLFVKLLSDAGVIEIVDITIGEKKLPEAEPEVKRGPRGKKSAEPEVKPQSDEQRYELKFLARAPAFVRAVNALATDERFITIDSFAFMRADDALAAALGDKGGESASRPAGGGRGRGRRGGFRAAAAAEETDAAADEAADSPRRKGLVVDPKTDTPFTVTLSVTTHDFGMGEELAADRAAKTPVQDDAAAADAPAPAADAPGDAVTPAATAEPAQNEED